MDLLLDDGLLLLYPAAPFTSCEKFI